MSTDQMSSVMLDIKNIESEITAAMIAYMNPTAYIDMNAIVNNIQLSLQYFTTAINVFFKDVIGQWMIHQRYEQCGQQFSNKDEMLKHIREM
jgi:hypothetical protein